MTDISKKLEAAVHFANFCRENEVSAWKVAEVIQLEKDLKSTKGWEKQKKIRNLIHDTMKNLGFSHITLLENIVEFEDKLGGRRKLPQI